MVFTLSGITPPKVNWFGWNLEHSDYMRPVVWGWPWQILGAVCAVAMAGEPDKFFYQVSNARFYPFSFNHISRNLNTTRRSVSRWILWEQNFTARHHTDFVSEHGLMTSSGHAHKSFNNITGNWVTDLHMTPIWWYAAASWKFLKTQCSSANKFSISLFRNDVWS